MNKNTIASWTTKNLLNHLESHHKSESAAEKPAHEKERLTKQYENPTPGFKKNRLQQAALEDCMPGKKAWAVDDNKAKKVDQKLIKMIVMDNQPFSIAEDDGFIAYSAAIYSERLFSEFGNLYEKERSRLLPKNSSKMLFLHHNYPI